MHNYNCHIKENVIDSERSINHGKEELMYTGYWLASQKERKQQEDQDEGGWITLKWILDMVGWYGLD
jgi:hypothetical protein